MLNVLGRAVAASAILLVAGCSGAGQPQTAAPAPAAETQACGPTELAFGEAAEVGYTGEDGTASPLEVTVTGIEQGDPADLDELELPAPPSGTPFYLTATVTNASEANLQLVDPAARLRAVDERCRVVAPLVIETRFPACDYVTAPEGFAPGDSFETCVTYLLPDAARVTLVGAQYTDPALPEPATWRR